MSSSLRLMQFFAPSTWPADNAQDLDMSTAPVLLPDGQVMLAGKARIVYLLSGAAWAASAGSRPISGAACGDDIDGGAAVSGMTVYLPCLSGTIAVRATSSPPGLHLLWSSGTGGGPPIVAAGLVWTIGQNGTLYGLDPATGQVRQQATIGVPANHFPTPSVAGGLLIAASADRVVAFAAPAPGAQPVTAPPASPAPSASGQAHEAQVHKATAEPIAAIVVVVLVVVIGALFAWRWPRRGR